MATCEINGQSDKPLIDLDELILMRSVRQEISERPIILAGGYKLPAQLGGHCGSNFYNSDMGDGNDAPRLRIAERRHPRGARLTHVPFDERAAVEELDSSWERISHQRGPRCSMMRSLTDVPSISSGFCRLSSWMLPRYFPTVSSSSGWMSPVDRIAASICSRSVASDLSIISTCCRPSCKMRSISS